MSNRADRVLQPVADAVEVPARAALLAAARARGAFPVVIVGAGINGLGTFRDLCLQGVDCLIVDRGDFCSGTSAAPSRMIHGGLKYLETGEFRLVAESVRERNRLLRNAPHLVRPLEMVIPIERRFGGEIASILRFLGVRAKSRRRGRLIIGAGLTAYDFFGRRNSVMPRHRQLSGKELRATLPDINPSIRGGASYFDARISLPERLGVELALDGMTENPGSIALNYVALADCEDGALHLRDQLSGDEFAVRPTVVINAAGAWIDQANRAMHAQTRLIGGTKGSHLLLDLPALRDELAGRMIYFDPGDGRICLVAPMEGKVLLGSTDIPAADPDRAVCEDHEIDYMFDALRAVFPAIDVDRRHIVFTYCGVRPLPQASAADPGAISRDHSINALEPTADRPFPILSLVGGKWTTFRAFGEEASDCVLKRLGRKRAVTTVERAIGGGHGLSPQARERQQLHNQVSTALAGDRDRAWVLIERYGARAPQVAAYCGARDRPLRTLAGYTRGEMRFLADNEFIERLDDLVLRRTAIALTGQLNLEAATELSVLLGELRDWPEERRRAEIDRLAEIMRDQHRIDIADRCFV